MTGKLLKLRGALAGAVVALSAAMADAASADTLEMFIENQSSEALAYDAHTEVESYPNEIAATTTSSEIRSEGGVVGQITYVNSAGTCAVTLEFSWIYNSASKKCDDKNFTIVNKGQCTLERADTCYGAGDCKCNFTFNTSAD